MGTPASESASTNLERSTPCAHWHIAHTAHIAHIAHIAHTALRLALGFPDNRSLLWLVLLFFLSLLDSFVCGRESARSALSCHVMPCNVKWRPKSDPGSFFFFAGGGGSPHVAASLPIGPALYPKHSHPKHQPKAARTLVASAVAHGLVRYQCCIYAVPCSLRSLEIRVPPHWLITGLTADCRGDRPACPPS